jgi:hypothetical protein
LDDRDETALLSVGIAFSALAADFEKLGLAADGALPWVVPEEREELFLKEPMTPHAAQIAAAAVGADEQRVSCGGRRYGYFSQLLPLK